MPVSGSLKRARPRSLGDDDHARSRPARKRRVEDYPKDVRTLNLIDTTTTLRARATRSNHVGSTRRSKRSQAGRRVRAGPVPRPALPADKDDSSDDGEDELELAGLESDLLMPSSPGRFDKLPVQASFPRGDSLKGFARKLDLPPAETTREKTYPRLNLPAINLGLGSASTLPRNHPHLDRSFSTPRKISASRSFAGETTEEEEESGDENGSDILSEIEEENREYYKDLQERRQAKGKGVDRVSYWNETRILVELLKPTLLRLEHSFFPPPRTLRNGQRRTAGCNLPSAM